MRFFHSRASGDGRGVVQIVWWEAAATTQRQSDPVCELAASCRCWRCAAPSTAAVWELGARVVERTFARLSQFRRLRPLTTWADIHEAFLALGCALICWQSLRRT